MSLRVGFELTIAEVDRGGTARAALALRAALERRDDVDVVAVAHPPGGGGRIRRGLARELWWLPVGAGMTARRAGARLLHLPAAIGPALGAPLPLVVTVHDVLALEHPDWFSRPNVLQQRLVAGRLARSARRVLTPSEHTRRAAVEHLGVAEDRVRVVPWGVGAPFSPGEPDDAVLARHGIDGPYVITVGTLQPRKNLDAALDAHAALIAAGAPHRLVVVGERGWRDREIAERLRGRAVLTGRVGDRELVALLRGADALVFPSRHEGFGFPPLEAMACGTPVVAYRAASVPEVTGDAAALADPAERGSLAEALARVVGSAESRDELRRRGLERAAAMTWELCADATVGHYRAVAGERA